MKGRLVGSVVVVVGLCLQCRAGAGEVTDQRAESSPHLFHQTLGQETSASPERATEGGSLSLEVGGEEKPSLAGVATRCGSPGVSGEKGGVRVAIVQSRTLSAYDQVIDGFKRGLTGEGLRPSIQIYDLNGNKLTQSAVLTLLQRTPPDVIVTLGSLATREVSENLPQLPLVFAMVLEPDFLASRATQRPIAGIEMEIDLDKQLAAFKKVLPDVKKLGVLYSPESESNYLKLKQNASKYGLTLFAESVQHEKDIARALNALSHRADALLALPDSTVYSEATMQFILLHTLRQSQPFMGLMEPFVQAGALFGLALDYHDVGDQLADAAIMVAKNPEGTGLTLQEPRRIRLLLNLRTARRIGVHVPDEIYPEAEVIVP